ncbi:sulfite exporter TauE/SafE family protein [Thiohalobacter sp.]|uniref:sulfite exporter TauE/SafE family protein n=1 Tax=Thiohalobacter sp. TaxID=2025948 RepID=UPI0026121B98|nr:sulfite exporter TauE/SafE family protein [Thiohalobacter sp.]
MPLVLIDLPAWLATGALAGLLAGLFGLGGGIVIVPALTALFGMQQLAPAYSTHLAVATSLATILVTGVASVRAHHRRGAVDWALVRRLLAGILLGGLAGAFLAAALPTLTLRRLFGAFEILVALQLLAFRPGRALWRLPGRAGMTLAGGVIGAVSSVLGIGGGTLTVPFLVWSGLPMVRAVAAAAACGLPIALGGSVGFLLASRDVGNLPPGTLGFVYLPAWAGICLASVLTAPIGARWAHRWPTGRLKSLFALVLCLIGLRMMLG